MSIELQQRAHVFISPHFDDVVLSCGGTIAKLERDGHPVTVVTTMGASHISKFPESPILADLHQRWQAGCHPLRMRRDEDLAALRSLGVECRHLPLADCVYRQVAGLPLYPTEGSLFDRIHPEDYAGEYLNRTSILDLKRPQIAYLPLAVGHHVDHQIIHEWGLRLAAKKQVNLCWRFYAEFPYSNAREAIADAMRRIGIQFRELRVELDEADVRAKVSAIACYRSQISTFWNDLEHMEADARRSMTDIGTGKFIERYWEFD